MKQKLLTILLYITGIATNVLFIALIVNLVMTTIADYQLSGWLIASLIICFLGYLVVSHYTDKVIRGFSAHDKD